ncbi:MAG: ABC transporter permease subunit [Pseudomonadota bacterium]
MWTAYSAQILLGTWVTVKLTVVALIAGSVLAMILAAGKLSTRKIIVVICSGFTAMIRSVPELLVLFAVYFGGEVVLVKLVGHYVNLDYFVSGTLALSLIFAAYFSETLRGAYLAIPKGNITAAHAFGFSAWQRFMHVLFPAMWRYALPSFGNLCLVLLKDTSIVSLIGLHDLARAAYIAGSATEKPFTFYALAGVIYLMLTHVIMMVNRQINHKLRISKC